MKIVHPWNAFGRRSGAHRFRWSAVVILLASLGVFVATAANAQVQWDGNSGPPYTNSGVWSDPLNWLPDTFPNGPNGAGVDVWLSDIFTGGDINPLPAIIGPEHPFYTVYDSNAFARQVTLDVPGVTVNTVLIEEYPFPYPPAPFPPNPITGAPHRNVLKLDQDLSVVTSVTLRGSRSILELNGKTINVGSGGGLGTITLEAPIYLNDQSGGHYWFRNRIGANVSLNDGLDGDLPASLVSPYSLPGPSNPYGHPNVGSFDYSWGSAFPVLPYAASNLTYVPDITGHTPLQFSTNDFAGPNGPVSGATSGVINAHVDSQGMVWLNNSSRIEGNTNNHSAFGYFRYDSAGVPANLMHFAGNVTNSDQHAIMDINGRGFYNASVTNSNLGTMYMRSRSDIRNQWTNQSGGQFLFKPTVAGSNPNDPDGFTGNLFRLNREALNQGFAFASNGYPPPSGKPGDPPPGNISAPYHPSLNPGLIGGAPGGSPTIVGGVPAYALDNTFPFATQADFDGDVIFRDTGTPLEVLNFHNRDGAIMTMRGNVNLGLIDRTPTADLPNHDIIDRSLDRIATLRNESGGFYTYEPRTPASQSMDITGEIVNDGTLALPMISDPGEPTSIQIRSVMNLFGKTIVRGRFLPTRPESGVLLTNTNGAVLNYSGRIDIGIDQLANDSYIDVPHGNLDNTGGVINGFDSGHLVFHGGNQVNNGMITLSDAAQFSNGRQGTSSFTNNGTLASVVYSGPAPTGYNPAALADSPQLNAGIFNNNGLVQANATTTLNLNTAPINNLATGVIDLNGGTLNPFQGTVNYGTTTFNGGAITGPFFLNLPGGLVNGAPGGNMNAATFVNSVAATMTLGGGGPAALQINSTTFTQGGVINVAGGFEVVANNTSFVNSGVINMSGLNANLAAPGRQLVNQGSINGSGLLGFTTAFTGGQPTSQVVNIAASSINVSALGMSIGGVNTPINSGTINIAPGTGLGIVAGSAGATFTNSGTINMLAPLNDLATSKALLNTGRISGIGPIDFGVGILNSALGQIIAADPSATFAPLVLNGAAGNFAPVGNTGTIAIQEGTSLVIPNTNFTNQGLVQMSAVLGGTRFNDAGGGRLFTNAAGSVVAVNGPNNIMEFTAGGASVVNQGHMIIGTSTLASALAINPALASGVVNSGRLDVTNSLVGIGGGSPGGIAVGGLPAGVLGSALFTNNAGTVEVTVGGFLTAMGIANNAGEILVAQSSLLETCQFNNNGAEWTVGNLSTANIFGTVSNNVVGNVTPRIDVINASVINAPNLINAGVITVSDAGSAFNVGATAALPGCDLVGIAGAVINNGGQINVDNAAAINAGAVANNAGDFLVRNGSTGSTLAFNNNNVGLSVPNVEVNGGSLLTTDVFNNAGNVLVGNGSVLRTDRIVAGTFNNFNNTAGAVEVGGPASRLFAFDMNQTGGAVAVGGGGAMSLVRDYNNSLGTLSLNGPTGVAGVPTLNAGRDMNITGGDWTLLGGADATLGRDLNVASNVNLQAASTITAGRNINNTGDIGMESGSSISNNRGLLNNGGSITANGASTMTVGTTTNTLGVIAFGGASFLDTFSYTQTGGQLHLGGGAAADTLAFSVTGGAVTLINPSTVPGRADTLDTLAFTNTGGAYSLLGGATARHRGAFINASVTSLQQGSLVNTRTTTNGGEVSLETASTFRTDENAVRNPFDNTGSVTANGGSLMRTGDFTNTLGAIAFGGASFLDTFDYTQTGGQLHVGGGAAADTLDFLVDGGAVTLINPSLVAGQADTLDTLDFTNTGGAYSLLGAATARHRGIFVNASVTSLQQASLVRTRDASNGGEISLETASTFRTDENAVRNPLTNTGSITANGGSLMLTGTFTNDLGAIAFGGGSFLDTFSYTQTGGQLHIGGGAAADTLAFSVTGGAVTLINPSVVVGQADTLDTLAFTNTGGAYSLLGGATARHRGAFVNASLTSLQQASLVRARATTNGGELSLETASVFRTDEDGVRNVLINGGSITASGGSLLLTGDLTTTAGAIAFGGGSLLDTFDYTQNGGETHVGGGAAMDAFAYANNGGSVTLLNPSVVVGQADTLAATSYANNTGSLSVDGGATARIRGTFTNSPGSATTVQNGSALTTRTLTNGARVTVAAAGSLRTDEDGTFRAYDNSGGATVVQGGGTLLTGDFTNDAGLLSVASANADIDVVSNAGPGIIEVNNGGALVTDGITSSGAISVLGASTFRTNGVGGAYQSVSNTGTVVVAGGSTLATASFSHGGSMSVSGGSTADFTNGLGLFFVNPGASVTIDNAGSSVNANVTTILGVPFGGARGVVKVNNGAMLNGGVVNLFGTLDIDPAYANFTSDANLYENGILRVDDYSRISVGGSTTNEMIDENHWHVDGTFRLNGAGANHQTFEIAGRDFGNTTNGTYPFLIDLWDDAYHDNFTIGDHDVHTLGTLEVRPGSIVEFLNATNNLNGTFGGMDDFATQPFGATITSTGALNGGAPFGGEALYVNRLVLDPNSSLDLGLLHVYYREVSFDGGITFVDGQFGDVLTWLANGITFTPGPDGATRYPIPFVGTVPEPSAILLASLCGLSLAFHRLRRHRT